MTNTSMRVCIHRGAHEIGGSCVEVEAAGQRIVLDVGLPLEVEADEALLPKVRGFREPDASLLGVVISHPHQDHYGLAQYLRPQIPILIGEAAARILQAARPFARSGVAFKRLMPLQDRKTITLGPFAVTPYLVDHSAYDAYALLVEAEGKRLFYSGDLRAHGRKASLFERLLRNPPGGIDVLLMEGTTIGRKDTEESAETEQALEASFVKEMRATPGLCLVWTSSQNIDRLVTIFKACKRAKRELILDLYTAEILRATGNPRLPQGTWKGVRVYVPEAQRRQVKRQAMFEVIDRYKKQRIFPEHLAECAPRAAFLFRPSMMKELERAGCLQGATLIYSLWEGYLAQERLQPFQRWLARHAIPLVRIHTSGHASVRDLQRLARAIQPRVLVPVHSAEPGRFTELFDRVVLKADGAWWEVRGQLQDGSMTRRERGTERTENKLANPRLNDLWQQARESGDSGLLLSLTGGRRPAQRSKYLLGGLSGEDRRGKTFGCKNHVAGEREIETHLLNKTLVFKSGGRDIAVRIAANAIPLGAKPGEGRQIDLLGFDQTDSPVVIEVKKTDANPVYAVVELCEYVWRLRSLRSRFEDEVRNHWSEKRYRGTWGILLAPEDWWQRHPEKVKEHGRLIDELHKKTKIRICSLSWRDSIQGLESKCFVKAGRPPIKTWPKN